MEDILTEKVIGFVVILEVKVGLNVVAFDVYVCVKKQSLLVRRKRIGERGKGSGVGRAVLREE